MCVGGMLFVYSVLDDLEGNSRRKHFTIPRKAVVKIKCPKHLVKLMVALRKRFPK